MKVERVTTVGLDAHVSTVVAARLQRHGEIRREPRLIRAQKDDDAKRLTVQQRQILRLDVLVVDEHVRRGHGTARWGSHL